MLRPVNWYEVKVQPDVVPAPANVQGLGLNMPPAGALLKATVPFGNVGGSRVVLSVMVSAQLIATPV